MRGLGQGGAKYVGSTPSCQSLKGVYSRVVTPSPFWKVKIQGGGITPLPLLLLMSEILICPWGVPKISFPIARGA